MDWQEMRERERDAWLAEKAGGWLDVKYSVVTPKYRRICVQQEHWTGLIAGSSVREDVPNYTTNLAAAMHLAEQLRTEHKMAVNIELAHGWDGEKANVCTIRCDRGAVMADGESVAMAIAKAAYRAFGDGI